MLKAVSLLFVIAGITIAFLPQLHDYYYRMQAGVLISHSAENVGSKELEEEWEKAVRYNEEMVQTVTSADIVNELYPEEYENILEINGIMGYVTILGIDTQLPIYHGTSARVLQKGAGHLPASSLPVGGKGTHCVITGHTGVEAGRMFNSLSELKTGDMFYLTVCGKELCYRVDNIAAVLPDDTELLSRVPGKDYCTLVTCTPYGVNTHRLLVRGERVENDGNAESQAVLYPDNKVIVYYILSVTAAITLVVVSGPVLRRRRRKSNEKKKSSN